MTTLEPFTLRFSIFDILARFCTHIRFGLTHKNVWLLATYSHMTRRVVIIVITPMSIINNSVKMKYKTYIYIYIFVYYMMYTSPFHRCTTACIACLSGTRCCSEVC